MNYYIEKLQFHTFFKYTFFNSLKATKTPRQRICYFYIDGKQSRLLAILLGKNVIQRMNFRFDEIRDSSRTTIGWKITHSYLQNVLDMILSDPEYKELFQSNVYHSPHFLLFTKKEIANTLTQDSFSTLWSTLLKIHACDFYNRKLQNSSADSVVFLLEQRLWKNSLLKYAENLGLKLIWNNPAFSFKNFIKKQKYNRPITFSLIEHLVGKKSSRLPIKPSKSLKIAIESIGVFNLKQKELFSDLAYFHQSELPPESVLLYINSHAITTEQFDDVTSAKIDIVALRNDACNNFGIPVFSPTVRRNNKHLNIEKKYKKTEEGKFIQYQIKKYDYLKNYWLEFFAKTNSKIHFTHFRWNNSHIPKTDALNALGGISALWQMSYFDLPSPVLAVSADVLFSFSQNNILLEKKHGSLIQYHVATGYPGDYRFKLLKPGAEKIRNQLRANGAKKIIAFFDENSSSEERWTIGNSTACAEYGYLLEKVIENPWLGVVFKPKKPHTLLKRLNDISELMDTAMATGRCHFFMAESSGIPPAVAALASDVAIHGAVWAATAGLEAALCGIPTLLMDHDNWHYSQLNQLGLNRVIFHDWDTLWKTLTNHWNTKNGIEGLGSWEPLLNQLDPFRDGKAAERMGTYLHWLIKGYEQGLKKETVLSDAAERYCKLWGQDKISTG
jgi:hypothetical protein